MILFSIGLMLFGASAFGQDSGSPAAPAASPPHVKTSPGSFVGVSSYPEEAARLHQEGTAKLDLHVNSKGRVTVCSIVESSGSGSLDKASCKFASHLHFDPARDDNGNAVDGETQFPMAWHLPK